MSWWVPNIRLQSCLSELHGQLLLLQVILLCSPHVWCCCPLVSHFMTRGPLKSPMLWSALRRPAGKIFNLLTAAQQQACSAPNSRCYQVLDRICEAACMHRFLLLHLPCCASAPSCRAQSRTMRKHPRTAAKVQQSMCAAQTAGSVSLAHWKQRGRGCKNGTRVSVN